MTEPVFRGVGVALLTVFDADGRLDARATASLADSLVARGVRAVVVAGTTGEASSLDRDERIRLLEAVRKTVAGRVPVVAGTGAPDAERAVRYTADAAERGADAVLVLAPRGLADPTDYYRAAAEAAGDTPVLAYHFPDVSPPGIPLEVLAGLPVAGMKDSSGDPERLLAELDILGERALYTGSSALLSFAGPLGCAGAILALANLEPEACAEAFAGDAGAQRRLFAAHVAARRDFPSSLKSLVAEHTGMSTVCRV